MRISVSIIVMDKLQIFNKNQVKNSAFVRADIRAGDTVKIYQKIKEEKKERVQVFEGVVIARKHGNGPNATFTVRKISGGIGVERTFPLHAPFIAKIEVTQRAKVRRSKLYYLRSLRGKKARLKQKQFGSIIIEEEKSMPEIAEEIPTKETIEENTKEKKPEEANINK